MQAVVTPSVRLQPPYNREIFNVVSGHESQKHRKIILSQALAQLGKNYTSADFYWSSGKLMFLATNEQVVGTPTVIHPKANDIIREKRSNSHLPGSNSGRSQHRFARRR